MTENFDNIADITPPSFLGFTTPMGRKDLLEGCSSSDRNIETATPKSSRVNDSEDNESTVKSTTMLLCVADDSRHDNTLVAPLVPLAPYDGEVMDIDDRGSTASGGK